jgi:general secretion pathway protein B
MSYILDALKKSEAERNRGVAPTLLAARHVHLGSRVGIWALLVTVVVNACLGAFWLFWRDNTDAPEAHVVTAAQTSAPPVPITPDPPAIPPTPPVASEPAIQTVGVSARPITASQGTAPPEAVPFAEAPAANEPGPRTHEMELANLTISTHVYADDAAMRAVTLNGRRLVEGDTVSTGVQLKEITETGVILDVNGRDVALDVLQDWR